MATRTLLGTLAHHDGVLSLDEADLPLQILQLSPELLVVGDDALGSIQQSFWCQRCDTKLQWEGGGAAMATLQCYSLSAAAGNANAKYGPLIVASLPCGLGTGQPLMVHWSKSSSKSGLLNSSTQCLQPLTLPLSHHAHSHVPCSVACAVDHFQT